MWSAEGDLHRVAEDVLNQVVVEEDLNPAADVPPSPS